MTDRSWPAVVDVVTGSVRDLGTARRYVYDPVFAPSSDRYAFLKPHGPGPISVLDAFVASRTAGDGADVTTTFDRDIATVRWSGTALIVTVADGMREAIARIPPGGPAQRVDIGNLSVDDVDAAPGGAIAFVGSSPTRPQEVYVMRSAHARPRR